MRYEYWTIDLPSDCEEDPERRVALAILQAREECRIYRMPCDWTVIRDTGESCRVRRRS